MLCADCSQLSLTPTPLALLALPSVGFICDPIWDLTAESRGIPFSPQLLHMTHNAIQARAHCSSSLATHCKETNMDVTVPAPEIFAQPSRETLLCNHTQAGIIYKLNHKEWWCPKLGCRNRYCYLKSDRPRIFLRFPFSTSVLLCTAVVGACAEHQKCSELTIFSFGIPQKHCTFCLLPLGFPGMTQAPVYQPMPSVVGMPAAMPMMPGAGGVAPMPGNSSVSVTVEGRGWKGAVSAA